MTLCLFNWADGMGAEPFWGQRGSIERRGGSCDSGWNRPARGAVLGVGARRDDSRQHGACVLDLCDAEFLDSSGLGVILRARALLARDDRALAIVCPRVPSVTCLRWSALD
jgi:hypothetical protein